MKLSQHALLLFQYTHVVPARGRYAHVCLAEDEICDNYPSVSGNARVPDANMNATDWKDGFEPYKARTGKDGFESCVLT